jgi:hypothetical protein
MTVQNIVYVFCINMYTLSKLWSSFWNILYNKLYILWGLYVLIFYTLWLFEMGVKHEFVIGVVVDRSGTHHKLNSTNNVYCVGFEVLTAVTMKPSIFWDITPCSQMKVNQRFGGACCLYLQGRLISRASYLLHFLLLLGLRFNPESRDDMFLPNSGSRSLDYTALYPGRYVFSTSIGDPEFRIYWIPSCIIVLLPHIYMCSTYAHVRTWTGISWLNICYVYNCNTWFSFCECII